ncbi:MAG: hypothetical protein OEZ39_14635 [Gammaproteobacteria bacterium]|nr:hypothetical protein [Gammaproteobacteria bacterium]MDH5653090.1 hypothetical protein [Gammaproteobacteria bacterium]
MRGSVARLPGVIFHSESPRVSDALPRMDVTAFVGFSEKGPLHTPVAVEDVSQYREIFGGDVPLAWDAEQKKMQYSLLGASVEAFFRSGGRRCWIVRVAKAYEPDTAKGAVTQHFNLPGLIELTGIASGSAVIHARSPGSWADNLKVGTRLLVHSLGVNQAVELASPPTTFFAMDSGYTLHIKSAPADLVMGDLIELRFGDTGLGLYLFVDDLQSTVQGTALKARTGYWYEEVFSDSPFMGSPAPAGDTPLVRNLLDEADGKLQYDLLVDQSPVQVPVIRRLRFDLLVWEGDALIAHLTNLAFDRRHPRCWINLPNDKQLYGELLMTAPVNLAPGLPAFLAELSHPRFPLAADPTLQDAVDHVWLPLSMLGYSDIHRAESAAGDTSLPANPRDGLDAFNADLFLDKDLAWFGTAALLAEAEHKRFIKKQDLIGIHSLLPIDEVSMIAVPDCTHRHWDLFPPEFEQGIAAPYLNPLSEPDEYTRRTLSWSEVPDIRRYTIQQSLSPEFTDSMIHAVDRPTRLELNTDENLPDKPLSEIKLLFAEECPRLYYFRVRAEGYGRVSPWSNTRVARIPETSFYNCATPAPYLLGLALEMTYLSPAGELIRFGWRAEDGYSMVDTLAETFELQRATDADFVSAVVIYAGSDNFVDLPLFDDEVVYYRVRALSAGSRGPWSNTIVVAPEFFSNLTLDQIDEYDPQDMLAVHYALLRFCAARADALAILSMPAHYRPDEVSAHLDALLPPDSTATLIGATFGRGDVNVPVLNWTEQHSLSYAALYYPWLNSTVNRDADNNKGMENFRLIPPDGSVCGKMAATSIRRGAWISAVNEVLDDVNGVSRTLETSESIALLEKQVNLIHMEPRGFVVISDDTLSGNEELRAVTVRRLMSLLRRIVLREGSDYIFEPNSDFFRGRVTSHWESVLLDLFQRGAFKGASAEEAFRIVTDESVNDERTLALGRFMVELHVAPSRPMKYINVRLMQTGAGQLVIQEF